MLPTILMPPTIRIVRSTLAVVVLVVSGLWFADGGEALAQDGSITLVKEATPADGTDFIIETPLRPIGAWGGEGSDPEEFRFPFGVAVGPDGSVYVADTFNYRIQQFDAAGNFVRTWGSSGSGVGQFNEPRGIAVGPDGSVYVADTFNHRIQQFESDGTFVRAWGNEGHAPGQFNQPWSVAVGLDGTIYVADKDNHRIQRFLGAAIVLDDAAVDDGDTISDTVTIEGLPSGSYTFTETRPSSFWHLTDVGCTDDGEEHTANSFAIALSEGVHTTCALTNSYITQTLTVQKVVVGGPLNADNFPLFVDGISIARNVPTVLESGLHTVTETSDARYAATFGGACDANGNVMLGVGEHLTCTITNTYITQTLTVEKVVVGGGPLTADNFPLFVDGIPIMRNVPTVLESGLHIVTETSDARYTATFGEACDANGNVMLAIGAHVTCRITNTLLTGQLVIVKDTVPDDATTNWLFDISGPTPSQQAISGDGRLTMTVASGSYSISESAGAATDLNQYTTTYACVTVGGGAGPSGSGTTAANVQVAPNATVICTFTNERLPASIAVTKSVGTDPAACAESQAIEVTESSTVYFCVTIENTGQLPLTTHRVEDPLLGIDESIEHLLLPDATLVLTHNEIGALAVVATSDITNTVTVTSQTGNAGATQEAESVTASDTGTATVDVTTPTNPSPGDSYRLHLPKIHR